MNILPSNITFVPGAGIRIPGAQFTEVHKKYGKYYFFFHHNAGFFSCCSQLLNDTMYLVNFFKNTDISLDATRSFMLYKNKDKSGNIFYEYFKHLSLIHI